MATSGPATLRRGPFTEPPSPRNSVAGPRAVQFAMLAVAPLLLSACTPSFHTGVMPPVERLSSLTLGVSTAADIKAALGERAGVGAVGLPDAPTQDMWVYESHEVQGNASHQNMLFVFVDQQSGVFNGYMWFRAGALMGQTK